MAGWTTHTGRACALPFENIDTDQLIPARFMSAPRTSGYGGSLLHDLRFDDTGAATDFPPIDGATVLVARRNFGSGSSREAAVYALVDFGVCAVIAPSFGDIFAANAVNNGLLPAQASEADCEALIDALAGGAAPATVDLEHRTIALKALQASFRLDEVWRQKLINGWDDIDLTLQHAGAIAQFRDRHGAAWPGAWPVT